MTTPTANNATSTRLHRRARVRYTSVLVDDLAQPTRHHAILLPLPAPSLVRPAAADIPRRSDLCPHICAIAGYRTAGIVSPKIAQLARMMYATSGPLL